MTDSEKEWLDSICKNCLKANGYCIKDDPYIGLCAKNDKEELLEYYREKNKGGVKSGSQERKNK